MSLQAILERIRAAGNAQLLEVEEKTRSQAGRILAQAQLEAQQIEEDARASASAPAVAERARIVHRARLEALRIVGDVREDLVDTVLNRTRERLASVRTDPSYPTVLRRLTEEALAELSRGGTDQAQILVDPRDKNLLRAILGDLRLDLPVREELNCYGGLIAKSEDGRVIVINTFESRLERATSFLRRHIAVLFEEEHSGERNLMHV
jgi:vacuolar-type H+-ATPase subunit E/Vma4